MTRRVWSQVTIFRNGPLRPMTSLPIASLRSVEASNR